MITLLLQIYSLCLEIIMFMFVKLIEMCARRMIQQNKKNLSVPVSVQNKVENLDHKHTRIHTGSCPVDTCNDNHLLLCMLSGLSVFIVLMEKNSSKTQRKIAQAVDQSPIQIWIHQCERENKEWNCHNFSECISINPFICYELILFKFICFSRLSMFSKKPAIQIENFIPKRLLSTFR